MAGQAGSRDPSEAMMARRSSHIDGIRNTPTAMRPPVRAPALVRQALVRRLTEVGDDIPLIMMVAPAGYGKTTALGQWASRSPRPFGWVQLDPTDNDPTRLVHHLGLALHRIHARDSTLQPAAGSRPADCDGSPTPRGVIQALRDVSEPIVLVLDDVHRLRQRAALDVVLMLAENTPPGSHVVVASRRPPRVRLARMRAQGSLIDVGPADLAFDEAETRELMHQLGIALPPAAVETLLERTEGWPAGVCLAALSMQGRDDAATVVEAFGGDNRRVVDYFRDEVLRPQTAGTARFLLRTAVLEQLSAPLCDTVLETDGSASWLARMRALNLFVVPLDDHDEWYRYQRLFGEMLRSELRRREPGETERIHRRAATWFDVHGFPELAIHHAVAGGDTQQASQIIATHVQNLNATGCLATVRTWLEETERPVLSESPPCAVAAAWVWALTGDAARARRSLRIAESGTFDGAMPDGSSSLEAAVLRTRAALAPDGLTVMRADAERAVVLEPPGSPWHTLSSLLHGSALLLSDVVGEATIAFDRAVRFHGGTQRPGAVFALGQLALIAADRGDWPSTAALVAESDRLIHAGDLQQSLPSLLAYAAASRLARHRKDASTASLHAREALRLYEAPSPQAFPWLAAQAAILLGHLVLDLDDLPGARQKAHEASLQLCWLHDSPMLKTRYHDLVSRLQRAGERAVAREETGLTPAEMRILHVLPTHLTLTGIAAELGVSRNTVKTQVNAIYRKLHAGNRTQAVREAQARRLLEP
jgi:LuxR family maltose regulon positive regulatory protein